MANKNEKNVQEIVKQHESSGKYFQVDGIRTFAIDKGTGDPVVCVHGVPTSSFLYRKIIPALSKKNLRGISIDLPGLGLSARPVDFDYSFTGLGNFLLSAVKELGIEKFHLVVHDIGGPVGFYMAAKHPEKVKSITILNTWVDVVNFKKPLVMRPFEKKILGEAELKMITHTTWPVIFSKMGVVDANKIPEEEIKAYVDLLKREDNGDAFLKIMRSFEDSEEFRNLCYRAVDNPPYPVQAIWGEEDPALTYERYGKEIKEAANLKSIYRVPSRHFLQEEAWQEIAYQIEKFVSSSQ